ncbi:MAG TPA: HAMP domain-containing protein [Candidatus Avimonoglobus intestinipullorum]|uniref:histidine kinase n=1 Tax=Candidatus Avimonoglobus intestinipullorum TaxID=2840699 RepID=A0A9D1LTJ2_9FIRM|nr:HAMP domain-containing protein [Candidatus Avimonoglobus intestinipullorum]
MATYFAVIMITLILMSIYILGVLSESLYESEQVKLFAKANIISETLPSYMDVGKMGEVEGTVAQTLAGTGIRGVVVNTAYTVLFDTNKEADLLGKVFMRDIIQTALEGAQAHSLSKPEDEEHLMSVAVPVKNGDQVAGAVYLIESVADIDRTVGHIKINLYLFSALISVLVGILSLGMSCVVTSPVDEVIAVAKEISKGNFEKRIPVKGHNELAQMAQTLNFMCSELESLEENRKKFVSDVSHELKTPLATIKLISDSIVSTPDPDPAMIQEFLGDLSEEVDRLTRIVERLLTLTKLDAKKEEPVLTPVDFVVMLNAISRKLTPNAEARGIVLYTDFSVGTLEPIMLDYDKIWEAVYNITDNAIKYSPEGGFVKMSLEKGDGEVIVRVEDNGPGIPEAEKEHIFERFYRLDDSRARDTGGTGLGLAIAKEAVTMHGGKIEVSSEGEVGSIFSIHLPYKPHEQ